MLGEGLRASDIGCPSYAPYVTSAGLVGIGTATPTVALEVSGSISATHFVGDGSGLTGMAGGDRITSGTTNIIANNGGSLTLTTAGTQRMIVTTAGNVGLGTITPTASLQVSGTLVVSNSTQGVTSPSIYVASGTGYVGIGTASPQSGLHIGTGLALQIGTSADPYFTQIDGDVVKFNRAGAAAYVYNSSTTGTLRLGTGNIPVNANNGIMIDASNRIGIGTFTPNATLQVAGTFIVSNSTQLSSPSIYVSTGTGFVGVGTNNPGAQLEVSSTGNGEVLRLTPGDTTAGSVYLSANQRAYFGFNGNAVVQGIAGKGIDFDVNNSTFGSGRAVFINSNGKMAVRFPTGYAASAVTAPLEVSGTISTTNVYVTATTGTVSATFGYFTNISATHYSGDGSGLTGVVAGSSDRIVSGTTSMLAVSSTGYVSLTQAGTNTGWFDPQLGLVTLGVTSTGGISGTNGYFSGSVGIANTSPAATLDVSGSLKIAGTGSETCDASHYGTFRRQPTTGAIQVCANR